MAAKPEARRSATLYWATWFALLALTVLMLLIDGAQIPRLAFLAVVLLAMLMKASLIGAHFMHLRFERLSLALMVIVGLPLIGALLFVLIAPDAVRISTMTP